MSAVYHKMAFALRYRYFSLPVLAAEKGESFRDVRSFETPLDALDKVLGRVARATTETAAKAT
jgi:hypothetical protein